MKLVNNALPPSLRQRNIMANIQSEWTRIVFNFLRAEREMSLRKRNGKSANCTHKKVDKMMEAK